MNLKYIALAAGILAAGPAFAQVSGPITQIDGPTDVYTGAAPIYSSTVFTETFESGTASSRFTSTTNPLVVTGATVGGQYSKPFGDTSNFYAAVQSSPNNSPVTLNLTGLSAFNQISFYWGSQDSYNLLEFLGANGSVVGSFTGGAGQAGAESAYETYLIAPSAVGTITGLRFSSIGNNAFEFDNVVVGNSAVPEPASWALMIAGVGMIGGALRRRSSQKVSVKFATA